MGKLTCIIVKLHSELANPIDLQLNGVGVNDQAVDGEFLLGEISSSVASGDGSLSSCSGIMASAALR